MSSDNKDNTNFGVHTLFDAPCPAQSTLFAVGLGRSGTTMLSRIMSALSIHMGDVLTPRSNEDKEIQVLVKNDDYKGFEKICRDRDDRYDKWGFKCPGIRRDIIGFSRLMRNPRGIVVFRDILAIALRNNMSIGTNVIPSLESATKGNTLLLKQIVGANCPTLMVSYEKALQYPEHTVRAIADHCGIDVPESEITRIVEIAFHEGIQRYLEDLPVK